MMKKKDKKPDYLKICMYLLPVLMIFIGMCLTELVPIASIILNISGITIIIILMLKMCIDDIKGTNDRIRQDMAEFHNKVTKKKAEDERTEVNGQRIYKRKR